MYLSLHWHGAEGLYTVKKLNYASLLLKKKEGITILKLMHHFLSTFSKVLIVFDIAKSCWNYLKCASCLIF